MTNEFGKNEHKEDFEMKDKVEKAIEEARKLHDEVNPFFIGPTSSGKSLNCIRELFNENVIVIDTK